MRSIAVGDLNGDGANDVVFAEYGAGVLGVFINHGDGTFAPEAAWSPTSNPCPSRSEISMVTGTSTSPWRPWGALASTR